jgi:hypothetical protein
VNAAEFADAAHRVRNAARGRSLRPPDFKAPPESGARRSLKQVDVMGVTGWIVAVRLDLEDEDVIGDMVDGVIAAARESGALDDLDDDARARLREAIYREAL